MKICVAARRHIEFRGLSQTTTKDYIQILMATRMIGNVEREVYARHRDAEPENKGAFRVRHCKLVCQVIAFHAVALGISFRDCYDDRSCLNEPEKDNCLSFGA